jgi:ketosteroid isomerase-like protein
MKKNLFPLLALLILIFPACQEQIDVEKEKQAIITVLNEESQAQLDRDFERLAACWVQDSLTRRLNAGRTGYSFTTWEEMSNNIKEGLANDSLWLNYKDLKYAKSDFIIKVFPDCAWATYNEKLTGVLHDEPFETESIHLTVLEKIDEQWKISAFSMITTTSYEEVEAEEPAEEESEE